MKKTKSSTQVRYLIVADPARVWQPKFDTSLRIADEALLRDIEVDFCDVTNLDFSKSAVENLSALPVQRIEFTNPNQAAFMRLGPIQIVDANTHYSVALQRKDPPVDKGFEQINNVFCKLPSTVLQINNPAETHKESEHEIPVNYPQYSIPTFVFHNAKDLHQHLRAAKEEMVLKPHNQCSGLGIEFVNSQVSFSFVKNYVETWGSPVIVQPYLSEIERSGDLRVLCFDGHILGQVLRVPKRGSRLANLHQGASSKPWPVSPKQREAVEHISKDLSARGIHLVGFDFIGDLLSEVNVTSPSALSMINKVMGIRAETTLVDHIENLRKAQS